MAVNKINAWHVHKWNGKRYDYCGIVKAETAQLAAETIGARYGVGQYETYPHVDNATLDGGGRVVVGDLFGWHAA